MKKLWAILTAIALLTLGCAAAFAEELDKPALYKQAMAYYKAEEYRDAKEIFTSLGSYKDSADYVKKCTTKIMHADYRQAKELYKAGDYQAAYALFTSLGKFSDSRDRAEQAAEMIAAQEQAAYEKQCYEQGLALLATGDWEGARAALIEAGPCDGATDALYRAVNAIRQRDLYAKAERDVSDGAMESAYARFRTLGDIGYLDSAERADELLKSLPDASSEEVRLERDYQRALALRALGSESEANELFRSLGDYRDAKDQVLPINPIFTAKQLRDDKTSPVSPTFTAPDGTTHRYQIYKGVHKWVEAKAFCEVLGGHLATLTTPEENAFVYGFMRDCGYLTAYFGLSDEKRVGDWIWVTGEPFEYANWHKREPSRSAKERYGMFFYLHTDGTWNDSHFYEYAEVDPGCSYICEWDD